VYPIGFLSARGESYQYCFAKIVLAEQGVHFKDGGRTIVLDGAAMSEDPEDMQKVREALGIVYKE